MEWPFKSDLFSFPAISFDFPFISVSFFFPCFSISRSFFFHFLAGPFCNQGVRLHLSEGEVPFPHLDGVVQPTSAFGWCSATF